MQLTILFMDFSCKSRVNRLRQFGRKKKVQDVFYKALWVLNQMFSYIKILGLEIASKGFQNRLSSHATTVTSAETTQRWKEIPLQKLS